MTYQVTVECRPDGEGWSCQVAIEDGEGVSRHDVRVARELLERLRPGADAPDELVAGSFAFLLQREPPGSILRSFELPVIGRYFPEWEAEIRHR